MAVNTVNLEVITPSKLFYKGNVEIVICRTLMGDEGFMAGHSWAVKLLDIGELWIREAGSKTFKIAAVSGGFVDVQEDIVIYTDAAEWSEDIDMEKAKSLHDSALAFIESHGKADLEEDSENLRMAKAALSKAITRMNVAKGGARRKTN